MGFLDDVGSVLGMGAEVAAGGGFPWGAAASLGAGILSYEGQQSANESSAASVQQANQLALASAQNKYQWTVKDMEAAGLNPMLAYSQGATGLNGVQSMTYGNAAGAGVNSAVSAYDRFNAAEQTKATTENIHADTKNKDAQTANIAADTALKVSTAAKADQERQTSAASAAQLDSQTALNQRVMDEVAARIDLLKSQGRLTDQEAVNAKAQLPILALQPSVQRAMVALYGQDVRESKIRSLRTLSGNAVEQVDKDIMDMSRAKAQAYANFYSSGMGKAMPYADPFLDVLRSAAGPVSGAVVGGYLGARGGKR